MLGISMKSVLYTMRAEYKASFFLFCYIQKKESSGAYILA